MYLPPIFISTTNNNNNEMTRPKGSTGTKQLTEPERVRVRTLFFYGGLNKREIHDRLQSAGHSVTHAQIRTAIREGDTPRFHDRGKRAKVDGEGVDGSQEYVTYSRERRRSS